MHHHAVALGLFMGPGIVLVAANALFVRLFGAPIGVPVSEAYPDEKWRCAQRAMRHVYRTGCDVRFVTDEGVIWIIPYVDPEGHRGVVSHHQPTLVPLAAPDPVLLATG